MRPVPVLLLALALGACATAPTAVYERAAPVPIPTGAGNVMGQDASALVRMFGQPDADVREGEARKLQFVSAICVLDAYLYTKGSSQPRVTWVDTRERDGSPIDRASCIAALQRRSGGR